MTQERLDEILDRLEQSPEAPLLILTDHEALEAFEGVRRTHKKAKLLVMKGMRYIAITEAAVKRILEQLKRERLQYVRTVEIYDKEIQGVMELLETDRKRYFSPDCVEPVFREK